MTDTQETERSPERYLQLAEVAEACAEKWRKAAEELLGRSKPDEPQEAPKPVVANKRPTHGRPNASNVDKVVAMCKRPNGATPEQIMRVAGWVTRPYPSTVAQLAIRRRAKFWTSEIDGKVRYHMSDL
jgi:hypothetical protein